jgi:hypothetical protein
MTWSRPSANVSSSVGACASPAVPAGRVLPLLPGWRGRPPRHSGRRQVGGQRSQQAEEASRCSMTWSRPSANVRSRRSSLGRRAVSAPVRHLPCPQGACCHSSPAGGGGRHAYHVTRAALAEERPNQFQQHRLQALEGEGLEGFEVCRGPGRGARPASAGVRHGLGGALGTHRERQQLLTRAALAEERPNQFQQHRLQALEGEGLEGFEVANLRAQRRSAEDLGAALVLLRPGFVMASEEL